LIQAKEKSHMEMTVRGEAEEAVIAYREKLRRQHRSVHLDREAISKQAVQEVVDTQSWRVQHGEPMLTDDEAVRYQDIWVKFYMYLEEPDHGGVAWALREEV
jgi:hypothetical protein